MSETILKVNPRAAMFTAVKISQDLLDSPAQHLLRILLGPDYSKPIELSPDKKALSFRFHFHTHTARLGDYVVRDRKTNELRIYPADEFFRLYYEYPEKTATSNPSDNG